MIFDKRLDNKASIQRSACQVRRNIARGCAIPAHMVFGKDHQEDRKRGFRVTSSDIALVTPDMPDQSIHAIR